MLSVTGDNLADEDVLMLGLIVVLTDAAWSETSGKAEVDVELACEG